jgi:hypothetical protein
MLPRILRREPNGQQRNAGMISSVEAPSADPAEQLRIFVVAVRIHESAVGNHESAPSVEEEEDRFVTTLRLQGPLLVATPSLDQEQDRGFAAWIAYSDDESRMRWMLRNPTGTRIPRNPGHYPSITRWICWIEQRQKRTPPSCSDDTMFCHLRAAVRQSASAGCWRVPPHCTI